MEMVHPAPPVDVSPPVENRAAPRFAAALVPSITGLRVSPHGTDATLVNISATGLLAECSMRLKVGSAVTLAFEGTFQPASAAARVVRCAVAAMGKKGSLLYHVGFAFDAALALDGLAGPSPVDAVTMMPEPCAVRTVIRNRW